MSNNVRNDVCSFLGYTAKQSQILGQFSQSSLLNMPRNGRVHFKWPVNGISENCHFYKNLLILINWGVMPTVLHELSLSDISYPLSTSICIYWSLNKRYETKVTFCVW